MKITVHERKSEDFNYGKVSTPVAQAYKVLDDYFCDGNGKLEDGTIDRLMIQFRNDRDMYNRSKSNAIKPHSLAWDTLLGGINALLEWADDEPHASRLTSEQVKNWFNLKGQDYKTELKPLVDAIDKQRKEWWGAKESKQAESIVTDLTKAIQDNKPKVLLSDDAVVYFDDYDKMLDEFEGAYQTIIHIENKRGGEEMLFMYVPDNNIIAIGDFDVDRADAERAKELMEKFVRGELEQKPGNDEHLGGLDYVAIVDGNNYTSTAFVEGE